MTLREIVRAQFRHEETDFVPYTFAIEPGGIDSLNEYYGSDAWQKELLNPWYSCPFNFDTWGVMRPIDPNDPTKKTDPFGCLWTQTDKISHLDRCAMYNVAPQDYVWPTLKDFYWPERAEILKKWNENRPNDKFAMLDMGAGYWEHMWRLLGAEEALMITVEDPDTFDFMLDGLDKLFHQFLDVMVQYPVDAILISDDWCDQRSCMMGPERWRKHIKPRLEKLYRKIHDHGILTVNHVCGKVTPLLGDLVEIGLDVLESVQSEAMDPYEAKKQYGDRISFWGGFGVQHIPVQGTPEQVRDEIRKLRAEMSKGGGYVMAPAKPLSTAIPVENLAAAYETFVEENHKFLG